MFLNSLVSFTKINQLVLSTYIYIYKISRFHTALKVYIVVFCVITTCSLTDGYQRFGGTYYHHLQGTIKTERSYENLVPTTRIPQYSGHYTGDIV
jgi:hypothetical protein